MRTDGPISPCLFIFCVGVMVLGSIFRLDSSISVTARAIADRRLPTADLLMKRNLRQASRHFVCQSHDEVVIADCVRKYKYMCSEVKE